MVITELLTILFIILKLLGVVNWEWVVVFTPEIIGVLIYVAMFVLAAMYRHLQNRKLGIRKNKQRAKRNKPKE